MIADAPAVPGAAGTTARLALAVAASALIHAFVLAGAGPLRGGLGATPRPDALGPDDSRDRLRVVLRRATTGEAPVKGTRTHADQAAPAGGAGLLPPPKYHRAAELDRRPLIRVQVEPPFPVLALAPPGRVVLRVYVNEAGDVDDVVVESADASGALAKAARQAFARARYYPGIKDGKPVRSLVRIEVLFGDPPPATIQPGR